MKKKLEQYYTRRARTYSDLDEPRTIVACVRAIGIDDHMEIMALKSSDKILDVGCGTGRFLKPFCIARAFGIDLTVNMLKRARGLAPLVRGDAEYLPFKDSSFDIVHSAGLLGVYCSKKILKEVARVAKRQGRVFISFPAAMSVSGLVALFFMKFKYNPSLLDYWYTRKEIKKMFPENVKITNIYRLGFEPPFQRLYKNLESKKLSQLFLFLEKKLRDKPLFKYFGARFLVEGVKT
jgi:ubiquinone/menaquinone biosynthesis C-methylase UbiE